MKLLKTGALALLLTAACLHATAQTSKPPINEPNYNKPKVFADLPEKLSLRIADAEALLNLPVGTQVNAAVANGFPLVGTVVSKSSPSDLTVQSIVIRSAGRQNATFTFTRIKNADGSFSYKGRMMGKTAGDALEITKEGTGYVLRKKGYYDLVNE
ncbi:hypothetical protein [Flavisolibacter ginsenosidimutans]|uniref:Uncharacterized protein n=1 Tax=Flavisolibacter ginsenosidimutans TaxID=661481 RepID=A0A5B8UJ17_9BACT|nr:hypothetical protein [Flavisolibacter ginsenosidimutans]QEC56392.1 hypothetical protein FSB75_10980 [Flavisolibacter ginsenosidimutans]